MVQLQNYGLARGISGVWSVTIHEARIMNNDYRGVCHTPSQDISACLFDVVTIGDSDKVTELLS